MYRKQKLFFSYLYKIIQQIISSVSEQNILDLNKYSYDTGVVATHTELISLTLNNRIQMRIKLFDDLKTFLKVKDKNDT